MAENGWHRANQHRQADEMLALLTNEARARMPRYGPVKLSIAVLLTVHTMTDDQWTELARKVGRGRARPETRQIVAIKAQLGCPERITPERAHEMVGAVT